MLVSINYLNKKSYIESLNERELKAIDFINTMLLNCLNQNKSVVIVNKEDLNLTIDEVLKMLEQYSLEGWETAYIRNDYCGKLILNKKNNSDITTKEVISYLNPYMRTEQYKNMDIHIFS